MVTGVVTRVHSGVRTRKLLPPQKDGSVRATGRCKIQQNVVTEEGGVEQALADHSVTSASELENHLPRGCSATEVRRRDVVGDDVDERCEIGALLSSKILLKFWQCYEVFVPEIFGNKKLSTKAFLAKL